MIPNEWRYSVGKRSFRCFDSIFVQVLQSDTETAGDHNRRIVSENADFNHAEKTVDEKCLLGIPGKHL